MSSFTRYAAVAVVVLSLGFLVASAPTTQYASIPAITGKDPVSMVCISVFADIEAKLKDLLGCGSREELEVAVNALVVVFKACADGLLNLGADVVVGVDAKANIATFFAALITLFVQVFIRLSLKFGLSVVVLFCARIDVVLRLCLVHLNICIGGILVLIAKAIASVTVGLLAQVQLKLCLGVLGL